MAVNELTTSGKWATGGNWSAGEKPKASHDVLIPKGKEVKIEAAAVCRSLYVEGNAKVAGSAELQVGNSEKPEGPAGNSWALKIDSEATVTSAGAWILTSTAAETQKVAVGVSLALTKFEIKAKSTAKYLLETTLTLTGATGSLKPNEETTLNTNGFAVKVPKFAAGAAKITLTFGTSTITCVEETFESPGVESTVSAASATIVMEGANTTFGGGGFTFGTLTVTGKKLTISGTGTTISTLNVNNKGAGAGEGVRLTKGMTLKVTTLATNGTAGEPARLESTEAAKVALLELGEQELATYLKLKDIEVPAGKGPWYLPHGTDEGGNVLVGTTIKFEAKAGEETRLVAGIAKIKLADSLAPTSLQALVATSKLRLKTAGASEVVFTVAGASKIKLVSKLVPSATLSLAGSSQIRFGESMTATGGGKKPSAGHSLILVFDE